MAARSEKPQRRSVLRPATAGISLGPLSDYLGFALREAQIAVFASFNEALSRFDLTPAQFSVLIVIDQNEHVRATDVCNALGIQKTNFAPFIRALEQRHLVVRRDSDLDRRTQMLQLTGPGRQLLRRAMKAHDEYEGSIRQSLGPAAVAELLELLSKLKQLL